MPVYVYKCDACGIETSEYRTFARSGDPIPCGCGGEQTKRISPGIVMNPNPLCMREEWIGQKPTLEERRQWDKDYERSWTPKED